MSITVRHISKTYADTPVLDDISFTIAKGEIVGFLGPNGAGKSTLMKILTTYIAPSSGTASVHNYDVASDIQKVRSAIGYLPEHNPLYLNMYVKEYLAFNASVYKVGKERIQEVIELTGLTPESHKKINQLSKGYRQRVGLATALLHDPEVLILDEPITGLDPNQLLDIRALIREVGKTKTILMSTHIMQEVEAICDRVLIINKGRIVADKKLKDLKEGQQQIIEVAFDYRVEDVALARLPHAIAVKNTRDFTYEIVFATQEDMRAKVFDFAHDNELKILQLNQKNTSLESLFGELTASS